MPQYMRLMYNPVEGDAAWRKAAAGEESEVSKEQVAAAQERWQAFPRSCWPATS